ncbi:MAG: KH domain-containing protein, partial [Thermoplasmatales archaeon]|nr:KH domain-containing protein [Thermoplasmatales archaeon]
MTEIAFSNEIMQYINMASNILKIDVIDCMVTEDKLIFIVKKGQLGIAIGSKAKNLEKLRRLFKK